MSASSTWNPAVFGYTDRSRGDDLTFDERDSAPFMPKCVVVDPNFDWHGEPGAERVPWDAHDRLRDRMSGASPSCIPRCRRSCAAPMPGSAPKPVIDYIKSLGVTSVELLPIHTFINDSHLLEKGLTNYWGYNSDRLLRARSALRRRRAEQRCASSRRWWRASTTPASK